MAPALGVLWGPEGEGGAGPLVLVGPLASVAASLLLSLLMLLLCASCHGQKKKKGANVHPGGTGDHENLVNGVSDREKISQSADSPGTDQAVSSSHNGPLTTGTVLTDTQDTSLHLSEEMLSSQSELRSSKCPQDRELPSIPPNSALGAICAPPASGDGTYEVVKEMAAASRDPSAEDSLYETVKELKDPSSSSSSSPPAPLLLPADGRPPSPCAGGRGPPCVEYASVDLRKKSRHSADLGAGGAGGRAEEPEPRGEEKEEEEEEEEEEERPPPVPEKVLDENDNQPLVLNGLAGAGLQNGELSAVYSMLGSPCGISVDLCATSEEEEEEAAQAEEEEENEHDYSSIAEIKGLIPSSSDLYATLRDVYPEGEAPRAAGPDPGYETISLPKTPAEGQGSRPAWQPEPDYESFGELALNRETSRL